MPYGIRSKNDPDQLKKQVYTLPEPNAWLICAVILYLLSFLFGHTYTTSSIVKQEKKKLESYIHLRQNRFENLVKDTSLIFRLANRSESSTELENLAERKTGIFIFRKDRIHEHELVFWSSQNSFPSSDIPGSPDDEYLRKQDNGYYLTIKRTIPFRKDRDSLILIGMIPIQYEYFVTNDNLTNNFVYSGGADAKIFISGLPTGDSITSISGKRLFYIEPIRRDIAKGEGGFAGVLRIMAVILLLFYIYLKSEKIARVKGFWEGFFFLIGILIILRLVSYFTDFPLNFRQFELFNPRVYGSNPVHKSLGDLLINSIFFTWIILFAGKKLDLKDDYQFPKNNRTIFIGLLSIILIVVFTFLVAHTIRSLAADSNISFDVINVFSLDTFTAVGFITLSIISVGYYYFMRIMIPLITAIFEDNFLVVYLAIAITGLTYLTLNIDNPLMIFYMITIGWLLFYTYLLGVRRFAINKKHQTMAGALFWIFIFSVSITLIIINANREKEWEQRKQYAIKIDDQSDPYNETALNISLIYFDNTYLRSNLYRFYDESMGRYLRDSILRQNTYLNKYDSRLYVFDANKSPVNNDEPKTYNTLELMRVQSNKTTIDSLYYYDSGFGKYTFIFKKDVRDEDGKLMGTIFIESDPERYSSESLYPELFKRAGRNTLAETQGYSYAIYLDGKLVSGPFNTYSFITTLSSSDIPNDRFVKKSHDGYVELWYKASNDKTIVIVRKKNTILEAITLFSYIFCVFLFLVALFNFLLLGLRVGGNLKKFRQLLVWDIRTQIHSTIIMISLLSFVIIGVATISFFIRRYDQNNEEKLSRTMEIVLKELQKKLDKRRAMDDLLAIYDSVSNDDVLQLVNDVSEIHNVDVNVYDTLGKLYITSQAIVYQEGYLSNRIHPVAFFHLNKKREVQFIEEEKLSKINYLSIYAPLRSEENGVAYAYVNIPYFSSQSGLTQEISNFIVAIINLNAFIFLIAGVIALFITNRVTRSFTLIAEKMKEVNLGQTNEEIEWNRDDEIGGLVREYNKMVNKLEVSAEALARSEREGAWREMARQVAHEIKNPLTPMKLSIQYLQRAIDNNSSNIKELTANVANTLVEQIDHLSKIAFDFSQFANISNTNNETFDINEVIHSLDNLYKTNENINLEINTIRDSVLIKGDRTHMNRLFTNLIQNAIEACEGKEECVIKLDETRYNGVVRISVKDNGAGIPSEMQSKIFIPNFTTKSSGTGLGLAMCKGIAEQAGGKIWFETMKDKGSTFFVELPVVN